MQKDGDDAPEYDENDKGRNGGNCPFDHENNHRPEGHTDIRDNDFRAIYHVMSPFS
jgi:hypothetical protein